MSLSLLNKDRLGNFKKKREKKEKENHRRLLFDGFYVQLHTNPTAFTKQKHFCDR